MSDEIKKKFLTKYVAYPSMGLALAAMAVVGVGSHQARQAEYARLCKNQLTGKRVDDELCEEGEQTSSSSTYYSSSRWYWQPATLHKESGVPKVGDQLNGGSDSAPSDGFVYKSLPREGGDFETAYKQAKSHDVYERGLRQATREGGRKGGFGSGFRTGGGHGG